MFAIDAIPFVQVLAEGTVVGLEKGVQLAQSLHSRCSFQRFMGMVVPVNGRFGNKRRRSRSVLLKSSCGFISLRWICVVGG